MKKLLRDIVDIRPHIYEPEGEEGGEEEEEEDSLNFDRLSCSDW